MHFTIVIIFALFPFLSISQKLSDKEILERQLPILYKINQALFQTEEFYEEYEKDTLQSIEFFNKNRPDIDIENLVFDLTVLQDIDTQVQALDLKLELNTNDKLPKSKVKIIENNLTDLNGQKVILQDSIGQSKGGGYKTNNQFFYFNNLGAYKITGYIDVKMAFLSGYENFKINKSKRDSLITIENKTIKIIEFGENYILLQGDREILQNIEYSNLTDDNFAISAVKDEVERERNQFRMSDFDSGTVNISSPSNKSVFPYKFFDKKIKNMSFEEYTMFFDENIDAFKNSEYKCLIRFNTKIFNLFLHLPKYQNYVSKKIQVDNKIIKK